MCFVRFVSGGHGVDSELWPPTPFFTQACKRQVTLVSQSGVEKRGNCLRVSEPLFFLRVKLRASAVSLLYSAMRDKLSCTQRLLPLSYSLRLTVAYAAKRI